MKALNKPSANLIRTRFAWLYRHLRHTCGRSTWRKKSIGYADAGLTSVPGANAQSGSLDEVIGRLKTAGIDRKDLADGINALQIQPVFYRPSDRGNQAYHPGEGIRHPAAPGRANEPGTHSPPKTHLRCNESVPLLPHLGKPGWCHMPGPRSLMNWTTFCSTLPTSCIAWFRFFMKPLNRLLIIISAHPPNSCFRGYHPALWLLGWRRYGWQPQRDRRRPSWLPWRSSERRWSSNATCRKCGRLARYLSQSLSDSG